MNYEKKTQAFLCEMSLKFCERKKIVINTLTYQYSYFNIVIYTKSKLLHD